MSNELVRFVKIEKLSFGSLTLQHALWRSVNSRKISFGSDDDPVRDQIRDPIRNVALDAVRDPDRDPVRYLIYDPVHNPIRDPVCGAIRSYLGFVNAVIWFVIQSMNRFVIRSVIRSVLRSDPI